MQQAPVGIGSGAAVAAVRPEDFRPAGEAAPDRVNIVNVRVEVAEFHGREVAAEGVTDDGQVIHFRLPERVAPGSRVELTVPVERVLVFAGEKT
ncbi:TOBE domain-containing protein [Actinomadura rugatobispora]|uniref:TOBE domain-containing protein n=1 Tax=Actinomadura rugatobispora TaxID=1994 RepID=A0ABW1ACX1_9ACTN|nr:hypothetical protein GCM10010200_005270 [Actinomadura rugatobispora]